MDIKRQVLRQMHNNKEIKKIKIFSSVPMMGGMIFMLILSYGLFLFVMLYEPARIQMFENLLSLVILCIGTIGLSTIAFIYTARRWFTLLVIDSKGIRTSLFHFFYRKVIPWENVKEILYYERLSPFIFITDGESLQNLTYEEIIKRKDVLQISLTSKLYKMISSYSSKPILGLTQEKVDFLKLEK
jgi:hypothetical protein